MSLADTSLANREFSRRRFLAGGVVATAAAAGIQAAEAAEAPYLPYTADSFYRSRVHGAPVDVARTDKFRSFMRIYPDQVKWPFPKINGIGSNKWGTAYAEGNAADPVWRLTGPIHAKVADLRTVGFHAPEWLGQMITGTNDSPFCVLDRGSGFTVHAVNAAVVGDHLISVSSAGRTWHSSNGLHHKNPRSNDTRNVTSRGRISDAMVIRRDLVNAAAAAGTGLGHVLHLFICKSDYSTNPPYCHPMVGGESKHVGGFGAEGERIAIDPQVDLVMRGLTGAALVVARTLQEHGCYIGDNAGMSSALKAEQDSATRQNWTGTNLTQSCLSGKVTWDDFIVLPFGWQ